MRKNFVLPALLVGLFLLAGTQAFAQNATVVLRSGERFSAEVVDMGAAFTFRVNGQERKVAIPDVVLIDFMGNGTNLPDREVSKVRTEGPLVVMRSGEMFAAALTDISGRPNKGRFSNGRSAELSTIGRIYLGRVEGVPGIMVEAPPVPEPGKIPPPSVGTRTVIVPSNIAWTNTGINVIRGQVLSFDASGEVRLSLNGDDRGTPAGAKTQRYAPQAPIAGAVVGTLIGRIGNGEPFVIGDRADAIPMPATGRLYLGINDDHVPDNSGSFHVVMWRP